MEKIIEPKSYKKMVESYTHPVHVYGKKINLKEGVGAGYDLTFLGIKLTNVKVEEPQKDEDGFYTARFTADIVPGEYNFYADHPYWTLGSYTGVDDKHDYLHRDWKKYTIDSYYAQSPAVITGGEVEGVCDDGGQRFTSWNSDDNGPGWTEEDYIREIESEEFILGDIYGGGYAHSPMKTEIEFEYEERNGYFHAIDQTEGDYNDATILKAMFNFDPEWVADYNDAVDRAIYGEEEEEVKYRITGIDWDVDDGDDLADLPEEAVVVLEDGGDEDDAIDQLSDDYGFLVNGVENIERVYESKKSRKLRIKESEDIKQNYLKAFHDFLDPKLPQKKREEAAEDADSYLQMLSDDNPILKGKSRLQVACWCKTGKFKESKIREYSSSRSIKNYKPQHDFKKTKKYQDDEGSVGDIVKIVGAECGNSAVPASRRGLLGVKYDFSKRPEFKDYKKKGLEQEFSDFKDALGHKGEIVKALPENSHIKKSFIIKILDGPSKDKEFEFYPGEFYVIKGRLDNKYRFSNYEESKKSGKSRLNEGFGWGHENLPHPEDDPDVDAFAYPEKGDTVKIYKTNTSSVGEMASAKVYHDRFNACGQLGKVKDVYYHGGVPSDYLVEVLTGESKGCELRLPQESVHLYVGGKDALKEYTVKDWYKDNPYPAAYDKADPLDRYYAIQVKEVNPEYRRYFHHTADVGDFWAGSAFTFVDEFSDAELYDTPKKAEEALKEVNDAMDRLAKHKRFEGRPYEFEIVGGHKNVILDESKLNESDDDWEDDREDYEGTVANDLSEMRYLVDKEKSGMSLDSYELRVLQSLIRDYPDEYEEYLNNDYVDPEDYDKEGTYEEYLRYCDATNGDPMSEEEWRWTTGIYESKESSESKLEEDALSSKIRQSVLEVNAAKQKVDQDVDVLDRVVSKASQDMMRAAINHGKTSQMTESGTSFVHKSIKVDFPLDFDKEEVVKEEDARKLLRKIAAERKLRVNTEYKVEDSYGYTSTWEFNETDDPGFRYVFSCKDGDYSCFLYLNKRRNKVDLKNSKFVRDIDRKEEIFDSLDGDKLTEATRYTHRLVLKPNDPNDVLRVRMSHADTLRYRSKEEADESLEYFTKRFGDKVNAKGAHFEVEEIPQKPRRVASQVEGYENPFEVGDILEGDFGYNMVLPVWYEVVKVTSKQVALKELSSIVVSHDGYGQAGVKKPNIGVYKKDWEGKEKEIRALVKKHRGSYYDKYDNPKKKYYVTVDNHILDLWDGENKSFDTYD